MSDAPGSLRVVPLGGLGEIGLNLLVLEYRRAGVDAVEAAVAVDCGVMFPGIETPGVDLMIPDLSYLRALGPRLLAVLMTHGHEDHIGALPFLLREQQVPIYGSKFTLGLVASKLTEHKLLDGTALHTFAPGDRIPLGPFEVEPLHVTHSIVDACGLAIRTPIGLVVHTGDFKIDHTPVDGRTTNLARFSELGGEGVLLLLSDSTNAERPGTTPSERSVGTALEVIFRRATGRILTSTFSSHIHRLQQIIDLSARFERRIAFVGRSLTQNVRIARDLGRLTLDDAMWIDVEAVRDVTPSAVTLVAAGSQGEARSALARIAGDDHPHVKAAPGDVVVLSSRIIPGNERPVGTLVNHLYRRGAQVYWEGSLGIHTSGHASQEELRLMMRLTRPRYFVPVHGEFRHLVKHLELAAESGIERESCFLLEDGQTLLLDGDGARRSDPVAAGRVFVDGKGVGDVERMVLRDRRHLAEDGLVLAILGVHGATGEIVSGPDLLSRGVLLEESNQEILQEARSAVLAALAEMSPESRGDTVEVQETVRRSLKRFFRGRLDRRPMILPFVMPM